MKGRSRWLCSVAMAPIAMSVSVPQDTVVTSEPRSTTSVSFAAGRGSYDREILVGASGCGRIPIHFDSDFTDVGAAVDYTPGGAGHIGVRGGLVHETADLLGSPSSSVNADSIAASIDRTDDYFYLNPYLSGEWTWIGLGVGAILSTQPLRTDSEEFPPDPGSAAFPSGHVRLGKRAWLYGSVSVGESVPIYSGGGIFNYGVGHATGTAVDFWVGKAMGPWQGEYFLVKVNAHPSSRWSIDTNIRFGNTASDAPRGSDPEYGVSLGVTRRFRGE